MEKDKPLESTSDKHSPPKKLTDTDAPAKSALDQPVDALRQPKGSPSGSATDGAKSAATPTKPTASTPQKSPRSGKSGAGIGLGILAVAVIAGLSAVVWWQHQRFESVAREVADRLQRSDTRVAQIEQQASQALSLSRAQAQTVEQTASRLRVVGNELAALEQAWQASSVGLDQKLLANDLRRLLTMANQQLVLMGNVSSAIAVLQSMQVMLESQVLPEFNSLTQAVNTDLARLQEVPFIDLAAISAKLESLIALSGRAPLMIPDQVSPQMSSPLSDDAPEQRDLTPTPAAPTNQQSTGPWWQQLPSQAQRIASEASRVVRDEVASLVSIRRADDPQALLLTQEQAQALRANIRSRLLSAQLALLTRQTDIWQAELSQVQLMLQTRYDTEALDTKAALRLTQELIATPLSFPLPTLTDSLSALELLDRAVSVPSVSGAN